MSDETAPIPPGRRADWSVARAFCHRVAAALPAESVPLDVAVGRTVAHDVLARCDVPHYDSSAMDGWAVRGSAPWELVTATALAPGQAAVIATGGLIPSGSDGVLRSEHGQRTDAAGVALLDRNADATADEPRRHEHIRPAGEEVHRSDRVIGAGTVLNPAHVAVAAVCGHDELDVVRTPRVGLILTGNEVVEAGIPEPGHVRDSFGPQLPALVAMLGATVSSRRRLPDDLSQLMAAIDGAAAEVIVTTGGTGGSAVDHLHTALDRLGAELLIDGVAMRPGGPAVLARLADGRLLVGLPGNPLAAMIGILTLLQPLLAGLAGRPEPSLGSVVSGRDLSGGPGRRQLIPYRLADGVATSCEWTGSGMMRGLAEADGILVIAPDGAPAGADVPTLALPWSTAG